MVGGLWRSCAAQFDWIDAHARLPPGRVDPQTRTTIVLLTSALVLALMSYGVLDTGHQLAIVSALAELARGIDPALAADVEAYRPLLRMIVWSLGAFTMYFALPALVIRVVFGLRLRDFGLSGRGFLRHLWIYGLLFIPVGALVLVVASAPDFQSKYPFYREPYGWGDLLVWEGFYALQFFCLEFFFRGFMLHGAADKLGRHAIFVMVIPYVMIHFTKPFYESIGAIIAGTVLGVLALRTRSIWGGWLIHVSVAVMMDIAALAHRGFPL